MITDVLRFAVIGGDDRQAHLAAVLAARGHKINCCGLAKEHSKGHTSLVECETISEAMRDSDVVLLPLPASTDHRTIFAPHYDGLLYLAEVFADAKKHRPILAGKVDQKLIDAAADRGLTVIDYFAREDLQILNTVPTAEGAIEIALHETPRTLFGSCCLVAGNGRIGKLLAHDLAALGAHVTVSARRSSDLAQIKISGHTAVETGALAQTGMPYDIIFNTIPSLIFDKELLECTPRGALIIDLASVPGGVNAAAAEKRGIKVIKALSLPGKVAPYSAGEYIADTVLQMLRELEI